MRFWDGGKANIITATNVFAHVDDLHDFLRGVKYSLADDGVFVVEVPYLNNLLKNNYYDTIYHEHLSYFLLHPLYKLFSMNELPIFRVEHIPIHGGSLRVYASKNYYPEEVSVVRLLQDETDAELFESKTYDSFAQKVESSCGALECLLQSLFIAGKRVVGYGASAKGISLLNYSGIKRDWIEYIVDETPEKIGKFTPGSKIPIVDFSAFEVNKPDYILLLAWNFAAELMSKTEHLNARYIIPMPEIKII